MPVKSNNASFANKFARVGYNTIVKRNSIFLTTIFVSAFAAEMVFDSVSDRIWDNLNKGVRPLSSFSTPLSFLLRLPQPFFFSFLSFFFLQHSTAAFGTENQRRHGKFGLVLGHTEDSGTRVKALQHPSVCPTSLDRKLSTTRFIHRAKSKTSCKATGRVYER